MPPDATLAYVLSTLPKPEDYVCGMLRNLYDCKRQHGSVSARLGLTGDGVSPHYRIEFLFPEIKFGSKNGILGAFDGRSHKLIDWIDDASQSGGSILRDEHWSVCSMTIDEKENFGGEVSFDHPMGARNEEHYHALHRRSGPTVACLNPAIRSLSGGEFIRPERLKRRK